MSTVESVDAWIRTNILDSAVWDDSSKQEIAVTQAVRKVQRWYPKSDLTDELVAYQAIWELQGLDPVLKYQKQGVKSLRDRGEEISYSERDNIAPEVKELLGEPLGRLDDIPLFGGELL